MELSKLKFTFEDFIKLVGFFTTFMFGYFNLVQEIRDNKMANNADKVIINYRLSTLEEKLGIEVPNGVAILPPTPTIKKEEE